MADHMRVTPSRLIFGTMRLDEVDRKLGDWVAFFQSVYAIGITKLHSSSEYSSFPLLCEILRALAQHNPDCTFSHMVKLAEPSFDDAAFDAGRLEQKIAQYALALGSKCIDDVQWMWRHNLNDDPARIDAFLAETAQLSEAAAKLKAAGKIKRLLCFPYSAEFADTAIKMQAIDGLTVYRNADETQYDDAINACAEAGKAVLVIRPLNAGKVLAESDISAATQVRNAIDMPGIEAGIISSNNLGHIREILA